jgi:hypothetical protein
LAPWTCEHRDAWEERWILLSPGPAVYEPPAHLLKAKKLKTTGAKRGTKYFVR